MEPKEQNQIHRLLQESIACYRKLMELYDRLRVKLGSGEPSETLFALVDQSRELYKVVQYVDSEFQRLAHEQKVILANVPLFFEWKALLEQVREENKLIRQKLSAAMAVLKDDINRTGQMKKAVAGYQSGKDYRGGKVSVFSA